MRLFAIYRNMNPRAIAYNYKYFILHITSKSIYAIRQNGTICCYTHLEDFKPDHHLYEAL